MSSPSHNFFFQEMKKHRVKVVVRVCDPTYLAKKLEDEGIKVYVRTILLHFVSPSSFVTISSLVFFFFFFSCSFIPHGQTMKL
jgi:hypothetical protein